MCFDIDSSPPIAPIKGAAIEHFDLSLTSSDSTRVAAFIALPEHASGAGVVILPDVRGLYAFYEELALRFAECGIAAIAIDWFGRTAGASKRDGDFKYMDHVAKTTEAGIQADIGTAVLRLRQSPSVGDGAIFTVGFCFGAGNAWLAAASGHGLAGAIGFYGFPGERRGKLGASQRAAEITAPILALQGGADEHIPAEQNAAFDAALTAAGVEHQIVTYDGAPHSFFDRKQEEHADASEDAWGRTLEFIERHSNQAA
jgi:carboxymethylenebutenolidase